MNQEPSARIEASEHSTDEVDEFLRQVEREVDTAMGAGSPAIKPNKEPSEDGKPITDTSKNSKR